MTNSKSVDYRFMTAEPFVMNNRTHCLIDGVQFVIYTIADNVSQIENLKAINKHI